MKSLAQLFSKNESQDLAAWPLQQQAENIGLISSITDLFKPDSEAQPDPYVIDFDRLVVWLDEKGKKQFGEHFRILPDDYEILHRILVYLYQDRYHAEKYNIDFRKGLLLTGPIGCGKTSLMALIRHLSFINYKYQLVSTRDICLQFMEQGYQTIKYYASIGQKNPLVFCFDDLGTETSMKYYGNETNVIAEILLSRYDLFTQRGIPTHITTNLSAGEIESIYGNRVRSRMREMFNLVAFGEEAKDKRV
jgi:hypothetical protein